ncbi:glycerophosphodiester phosphodiesterase [Stieleria varia]|nr:glycerophosphodiester phosphodiesterase [Stieleria varia]
MSCRPYLFVILVVIHSIAASDSVFAQMIVGHRGASADAPENTLSAFRLAWEHDADGVEGDFYLTSDRQIVCIHDKDTERTAGVKLLVKESTLQQLRQLEYGKWKADKWAGEPIATLEQVFDTVPDGKTMVIELKSGPEIVPVLAAELKRLDTDKIKILVIAFDQDNVVACKRLLPDVRVHWLTSLKQKTPASSFRPTAEEIAKTVRETGADGVGLQSRPEVITSTFVEKLRQGDCNEFHVWTVNDPGDAEHYAKLGSIGITTDHPKLIRQTLQRRSKTN